MRITKDLQLACDLLEMGFRAIDNNVLDILDTVGRYYDVKNEYVKTYMMVVFQYRYTGNPYREQFLFYGEYEGRDFKAFKMQYSKLSDVLLRTSEQLDDWKKLKMIDSFKFLKLLYDVILEAVEREVQTGRVYNDLRVLHNIVEINEK